MKHINNIYEALLNRKDKICSKSEIISIIKEYKNKFKSLIGIKDTIKYLSRHRYITRIFKSYYYINTVDERKRGYRYYEDKELLFIVLNKSKLKWYVGLDSASYIFEKKQQVPRVLNIVNNKFAGKRSILSLKIYFSKVKDSLFFGLKTNNTKNKIKYYYSPKIKTSLDSIYLRKSDKPHINKEMKKYLKYYPKWIGKK